ncbi:MAG: hypothetical protein QW594_04705 [Candidatus Woesearchaeota archaeon]
MLLRNITGNPAKSSIKKATGVIVCNAVGGPAPSGDQQKCKTLRKVPDERSGCLLCKHDAARLGSTHRLRQHLQYSFIGRHPRKGHSPSSLLLIFLCACASLMLAAKKKEHD